MFISLHNRRKFKLNHFQSLIIFLGLLSIGLAASTQNPDNLKQHVYFLASDELQGRYPGTRGDSLAAGYIATQMKQAGLKPIGSSYFQEFKLPVSQKIGSKSQLKIKKQILLVEKDFIPTSFSANGGFTGQVVFAGYGIKSLQPGFLWDDYKNVSVKNKWVLVFKGLPANDTLKKYAGAYLVDRSKAILAQEMGAKGILFVHPPSTKDDHFPTYYRRDYAVNIPALQITKQVASQLINETIDLKAIETNYKLLKPHKSVVIPTKITGRAELINEYVTTHNVVGCYTSKNKQLKKEFVVIGAHYDHIGMGGKGSTSRRTDTLAVHNGANDNASGVAVLLEVARQTIIKNPERSLVFIAFGAEEAGLMGSKYWTENAPIPLSQISAMINLDMVGNLHERFLQVSGSQSSTESDSMLRKLETDYPFKLKLTPEGYSSSDQAPFFSKNIPAFMFTTGITANYHTPEDDADKLNYDGMSEISKFVTDFSLAIANFPHKLNFIKTVTPKPTRFRFNTALGITIDNSVTNIKGVQVKMVNKDSAADKAGMKNGDIIIAINEKPVNNMADYRLRVNWINEFEPVFVDILRNGKKITLVIVIK